MTEFEFRSLSYEAVQIIQAEEATFFTLLFGYLFAAHYLGKKISNVQLMIFNFMYLATVTGLIFNMWIAWNDAYKWLSFADSESMAAITPPHIIGAMFVYTALVIASLYFMWIVRHQMRE